MDTFCLSYGYLSFNNCWMKGIHMLTLRLSIGKRIVVRCFWISLSLCFNYFIVECELNISSPRIIRLQECSMCDKLIYDRRAVFSGNEGRIVNLYYCTKKNIKWLFLSKFVAYLKRKHDRPTYNRQNTGCVEHRRRGIRIRDSSETGRELCRAVSVSLRQISFVLRFAFQKHLQMFCMWRRRYCCALYNEARAAELLRRPAGSG